MYDRFRVLKDEVLFVFVSWWFNFPFFFSFEHENLALNDVVQLRLLNHSRRTVAIFDCHNDGFAVLRCPDGLTGPVVHDCVSFRHAGRCLINLFCAGV